MKTKMTLVLFFAKLDRKMASEAELKAAGFTTRAIADAIAHDELRKGITGYWLPEPPDPGALAVMRRSMKKLND